MKLCLVVAAMAACSKHRHQQKGRSLAVGMLASEPVAPNPPWQIDLSVLLPRLQGAWVMLDEQHLGSIAAWEVRGSHVTIWDARTGEESSATLVFDAPCQYQLHFDRGYTTGRFAFDGTSLHLGLGDAGVKVGDRIIACTEIGGVVVTGTTCTFNFQSGSSWLSDDVRCTRDGDELAIKIPRAEYDPVLKLHGEVLADDQLWGNTPLHAASYADAKSKALALVAH